MGHGPKRGVAFQDVTKGYFAFVVQQGAPDKPLWSADKVNFIMPIEDFLYGKTVV